MKMNPLDKWLIEKDQQLFEYGKEIFKETMEKFFTNVYTHGSQWFASILPDIVGYSALAFGALTMLSSVSGRGMAKPVGMFAGILILSTCILEVA